MIRLQMRGTLGQYKRMRGDYACLNHLLHCISDNPVNFHYTLVLSVEPVHDDGRPTLASLILLPVIIFMQGRAPSVMPLDQGRSLCSAHGKGFAQHSGNCSDEGI